MKINNIEGIATKEFVKFAEDNQSDLIVISTHGLRELNIFFLAVLPRKLCEDPHALFSQLNHLVKNLFNNYIRN